MFFISSIEDCIFTLVIYRKTKPVPKLQVSGFKTNAIIASSTSVQHLYSWTSNSLTLPVKFSHNLVLPYLF